jgi:RNA polymerase sigma-70 factor (ECF subfamily)
MIEELIKGCRNNESLAQKKLFELFSPKMYGVCRRYANDSETARDILIEGFITVFEKINDYQGNGHFEGWIRRIFINTAIDHFRDSKRDAMFYSRSINEEEEFEEPINSIMLTIEENQILTYLDSIPEQYRIPLNLFEIEGYSHKEISKMLDISEEASRVRCLRARKMLAKLVIKHAKNERKR